MEDSRDNWLHHWQQFAEAASANPAQRMRHRLILTLLQRLLQNRNHIKLLDIGSGQGDLLFQVHQWRADADLLGIELSESGVAIARQKVPRATFVAANLFAPPPGLTHYMRWATHATCSEVLEHVDDPVAFLRQARQYLAEEAVTIVTVPGGYVSAFDRHIGHRRHFSAPLLRAVLHQAGFQVERIFRAGFPFFNLYRLLVIARGERLVDDATAEAHGATTRLLGVAMSVFDWLLRFNVSDSPFGWQLVAVAYNPRME